MEWVMPGMQCTGMGYAWNAVYRNGLCLECSLTEWVMPGMQCNEWVTPGMQCKGMGYAWVTEDVIAPDLPQSKLDRL